MTSRKEDTDGEDEVGERTQNCGIRHWGKAQRRMSEILVQGTGRWTKPMLRISGPWFN